MKQPARGGRLVLVVVASLAFGCGSGGGGGDATRDAGHDATSPPDAAVPCAVDDDCNDDNPCTADVCGPTGLCGHDPTREGEVCDDDLACTSDDVCVAGSCQGATATDCSHLTDGCNLGSCDEAAAGCVTTARADGTACDDGVYCTDGDACQAGVCAGGDARDCTALDGPCAVGACDESVGDCVATPVADDTGCDDGVFCTTGDACQAGACVGGAPPGCGDGDACTSDACDLASDQCVNPVTPVPGAEGPVGAGSCGDGSDNDCDGAVDGADTDCVECTIAADCDDVNPCTTDTCSASACVNTPLTGPACDDGAFCTVGDACAAGSCVPGGPRGCGDGQACTADLCDEASDSCQNPAATIDLASPVLSSAAGDLCLTAGTTARAVIWTELVDGAGQPVVGATVSIGGAAATASADQPGTYFVVHGAEAGPSTEAVDVDVTFCGATVTLTATVVVTHASANAGAGGSGGCAPLGGNLRVRVVAEESGQPIAGAAVLVGMAQASSLETSAGALFGGASAAASNVRLTDASGYVEFFDYGATLADRAVVTAGAVDRAYFTVVDDGAADLVLALPLVHPAAAPTATYDLGTATETAGNCNDLDVAFVAPKLDLGFFSGLELSRLFNEERCWDSGNGTLGQIALPQNLWIPSQNLGFLCLIPGAVDQGNWSLELPTTAATGQTENLAMSYVRMPLNDVVNVLDGGGKVEDLLALTTYRRQGFRLDQTVAADVSGMSINTGYGSYNTANAVQVTFSNAPAEADVAGFMIGDYSGANGTGDVFLIGHAMHEFDAAGSTVAIPNATFTTPSGQTALGTPYRLASVSALYLDAALHPTVAASRLTGVSTVLLRQSFAASAASVSVSNFLDIAGTGFGEPGSFTWDNTTRNGNRPTYSRHELGVRTSTYLPVLACATENDVRLTDAVQWIVLKPFALECGGQECFDLPTLPASFPRAQVASQKRSGFEAVVGSGASCASSATCAGGESCVDPDGAGLAGSMCMAGSGTAGAPYRTQAVHWRSRVYDLGLAPVDWSFDAFELGDHDALVTHESMNQRVLP